MAFKKKWENYWYHYKWHTIGAVFGIVILITFIISFFGKQVPDLYMVYMSNSIIMDEDIDKIESSLAKDVPLSDVDKDGTTRVFMEHIVSSFDVNAPMDEISASKIQTVMFGGQHTLMLVHQYALEDYDGIFENLKDVQKKGDTTFKSPSEGFVTGISVQGNEYLEDLGINTENLYVAIRRRTPEKIKEGEEKEYFDEAHKAMEYILSRQR